MTHPIKKYLLLKIPLTGNLFSYIWKHKKWTKNKNIMEVERL